MAAGEFTDLYVMDLGSDVRRNPKISGTTHNVFGIQTGVAIAFLVRDKSRLGECNIHYASREDAEVARDKLAYLKKTGLERVPFESITPDAKSNWLNQSNSNFEGLLLLADRQTKTTKSAAEERAVFKLNALGINTARDEWVYEFDVPSLREKVLFFADAYNGFLDADDKSYPPVIKWSRDLRNEFNRGRRIVYNDAHRIRLLYRPFVVKHHFANSTMNDVLTRNHYEMFGEDFTQQNRVLNLCSNGKYFYTLASDKLTDWHFTGDTQCLPLYRYTEDGERVSNVTQWGIDRINGHYRQEWGDDFQARAGEDGITAEDIFAYTYAVLHDPVYRHDYRLDRLRDFPRLPFYHEFNIWKQMGQELLDLHVGFEQAEPYPLERVDLEGEPKRVILRADKAAGAILLDDKTTLRGIPPEAWEYQLGSRSALEWVLDQYKERKPKDPTIAEKFNTYRFSDHKEKVIDLLRKVCTVSVGTMEIVDGMTHLERLDLLAEVGHPLA